MIGGALGRHHLSRRSPALLRRMGWRAALLGKVMPGAGSSTWRSPPLLRRSPWTASLDNKVVPGAGSSTPPSADAECGSQAVARPPPPVVAPGAGLHPAGHLSSTEVQVPPPPPDVAARVGFHGIDSDAANSSKAVPSSSPATTGVAFQGKGAEPTTSMAAPPAPRAAVGMGLHPVGHLSSMDVQVPPPPTHVATGVRFDGIYLDDPDSSKTAPLLPPPATTGVGHQGTDPTSSMAVPPAPPATTGVGLQGTDPTSSVRRLRLWASTCSPSAITRGGHLSSSRCPALREHPSVEMVVPGPGSPPQYGSPAISIQPLPASSGVDLIVSDFNKSMRFPPPVSHPHPLSIQENGRGFRRSAPHLSKVSGSVIAARCGDLQANLPRFTKKNLSPTRLQSGSPAKYESIQPLPTYSGIDLSVSDLNLSMLFPLPVSHPHRLFIQENGRAFRRSTPHLSKAAAGYGDMHNTKVANQLKFTKKIFSSTRLQSRSYSEDTRIPLLAFDQTLPPPPGPPSDLTAAPRFDSALSPSEKMIAQGIRAVSYATSVVFDVLEEDKDLVAKSFLDVNTLKTMYEEYGVEEALEIRGLLLHDSLEDSPLKRRLSFEHGFILGIPQDKVICLSTWRIMEILIRMPRDYWSPFFDFLSTQRIIIYSDWKVKLSTWISFDIYSVGVECAPDHLPWYRSESDASFDNAREKGENDGNLKLADIGVLVWQGKEVVWCEIYKDFPCRNSVEAEATGMYLQLRRTIGLDYLKAHTDSNTISRVVLGKLHEGKDEEETKLYKLLQVLTGYFRRVVPRWVPREEVKFVDGLLRNPKVLSQTGVFERGFLLGNNVVREWKPHLRGDPIFTIIRSGGSSRGKYKGNCELEYHDKCFLTVKKNGKIDGVYHVIHALCPADVQIVANKVQAEQLFDELKRISELLGVLVTREESECFTFFKMELIPRFRSKQSTQDLIIVLDSSLPRDWTFTKKTFTVFLVSESEKKDLGSDIVKFSPISFVSFQQFIKL